MKASNQFEPNFNFKKDFFGQLKLNKYSGFDPFKSQILTEKQSSELIKLCEFNWGDKFKLFYRASEHGFGSNAIHSKCDDKRKTLTIFKGNGFIFGGFTSTSWDSSGQYKSDPNAFLFSLTNKETKNVLH